MIKSKTRVRIFSAIVVAYMLFALAWWALLLFRKTATIHDLKQQNITLYPEANREFSRQQNMIYSEGLVFGIAMILGVILLNQAFKREMAAAKQQKNFLLSVTHELKSPITAIRLILDTFQKRKLDQSKTEMLIKNGQQEVGRLSNLVEDLLTAARLNPKTTLVRDFVDVHIMLETLKEQFMCNYDDFIFRLDTGGSRYLGYTNEPSLYLIVSNLLDNAVKYSGDKNLIEILLTKKHQSISIRVSDHGIGIPDKEKKRIFDQFYRIGDEDVRSTTGTGLGLFLVNELCSKLDIKISVVDNTSGGSIFELLIPTN